MSITLKRMDSSSAERELTETALMGFGEAGIKPGGGVGERKVVMSKTSAVSAVYYNGM